MFVQDIRSFFSVGAKTAAASAAPSSAQKRKPIVLDDSDNEDDNRKNGTNEGKAKSTSKTDGSKSKKRRVIYSSDEDEPKESKSSKDPVATVSSKLAKMKAIDVSSAFGSEPIKRVEKEKKPSQLKNLDVFDADTDDMELMNVDEEILTSSAKKKDSNKKDVKVKEEIKSPVKDKTPLKTKNNKTPEKVKQEQKSPDTIKAEKKTPIKKEKRDESKDKKDRKKDSDDERSTKKKKATPSSNKKPKQTHDDNELEDSMYDADQEKHEKRRAAAMLYKQFQKRAGPSNPGSKEIPKGTPNCLEGLAFILTGVFESMEREEAAAVIKDLGGRVTSAISKKTNYVVAGEESGPAKLAKAEDMNIPVISEDDLLDLIREKSGLPTLKKKKVKEEMKSPQKEEKQPTKEVKKEKRNHSPTKHESPKKTKVEEKKVTQQGIT